MGGLYGSSIWEVYLGGLLSIYINVVYINRVLGAGLWGSECWGGFPSVAEGGQGFY